MKVLTIIACLLILVQGHAQTGYNIPVKIKPYKNAWIYLGYHYGNVKALADSALLDANSSGKFTGKQALPGGIYFIVSPSKQILFEVLLDKDQQFSIVADTTRLPQSVEFTGSADNTQFHEYTVYAARMGAEKQFQKMQLYRDSIVKKSPSSFLSLLFKAMNEPRIPPPAEQPGGKFDSNFVYEFYKEHYWDNMPFDDNRLVRTPFFEAKLEKYFKDLVSPNPDSLIREIDWMLLYSRTADEMYRYLMVHFVQKYINPQYMGQDAVFVHLFEKYINTGKADFFTKEYREFTTRRAYSLMANLIGRPAAPLNMVDTAEKPLPLYNLPAEFTVICFWDPTCSHCKDVVPRVDSIYNAKWKNEGVVLYGVKTEGTKAEWLNFIKENNLRGWHHVYQLPSEQEKEVNEQRPGYKQLYDVYQTPLLYLLDSNKRIIAKKLTYLQIDEVIDAKLKSSEK